MSPHDLVAPKPKNKGGRPSTITKTQRDVAIELFSCDLSAKQVGERAGMSSDTASKIRGLNKELIREKNDDFRVKLLDVLSSQIARFNAHITDEKLEKASAYQLAGMSALYIERYNEVLSALFAQSQDSPQSLTLVQINETKGDIAKRIGDLRDHVDGILKKRSGGKVAGGGSSERD